MAAPGLMSGPWAIMACAAIFETEGFDPIQGEMFSWSQIEGAMEQSGARLDAQAGMLLLLLLPCQ